jgi:predicted transcriptional regulator
VAKQSHTLMFCSAPKYVMISTDSLRIMAHIIRFCETSKDKGRITNRLGLNDVQAESYLTILTRQRMIMQNNGKYVTTLTGQSYLNSHDRLGKIRFYPERTKPNARVVNNEEGKTKNVFPFFGPWFQARKQRNANVTLRNDGVVSQSHTFNSGNANLNLCPIQVSAKIPESTRDGST